MLWFWRGSSILLLTILVETGLPQFLTYHADFEFVFFNLKKLLNLLICHLIICSLMAFIILKLKQFILSLWCMEFAIFRLMARIFLFVPARLYLVWLKSSEILNIPYFFSRLRCTFKKLLCNVKFRVTCFGLFCYQTFRACLVCPRRYWIIFNSFREIA